MPQMTLHFITARQQLAPIRPWLEERLQAAFAASARLVPLGDTDVIVRAGKDVMPNHGHMGYAPEKGVVYVTVDPEHPELLANPRQSLERMLAHELHHSARWDGPGYGKTLGEALVSEGLAGWFEREVFGGAPEAWEALPESSWRPFLAEAKANWPDATYDHDAWFFGSQDLPDALGYTLGYQLVGRYLSTAGNLSASGLVHAPSSVFRASCDAL